LTIFLIPRKTVMNEIGRDESTAKAAMTRPSSRAPHVDRCRLRVAGVHVEAVLFGAALRFLNREKRAIGHFAAAHLLVALPSAARRATSRRARCPSPPTPAQLGFATAPSATARNREPLATQPVVHQGNLSLSLVAGDARP